MTSMRAMLMLGYRARCVGGSRRVLYTLERWLTQERLTYIHGAPSSEQQVRSGVPGREADSVHVIFHRTRAQRRVRSLDSVV